MWLSRGTQLTEYLSSILEALALILSIAQTGHGGTHWELEMENQEFKVNFGCIVISRLV